MRVRLALGAAVALAALAACGERADPCAFASPGARWVAFTTREAGQWDVALIRADGSCRRAVTSASAQDLHPAFGRGALLAYDSDRAPGPGLWLQHLGSGAEHRLDLGDLGATSPAFSPDGATLYFVSDRGGAYDVYRIPAAGGDAERVTTGSGIVGKPAVSPDGHALAYARAAAGGSTEVVLLDLASGAATPFASGASEPAFDPSGGRQALRAEYLLTTTLDLLPLDGSPGSRLTTGPGPDAGPAFAR